MYMTRFLYPFNFIIVHEHLEQLHPASHTSNPYIRNNFLAENKLFFVTLFVRRPAPPHVAPMTATNVLTRNYVVVYI